MSEDKIIPYGYCHCGCGKQTQVAKETSKRDGWIKGEPLRYILGHNMKGGKRSHSIESKSKMSLSQKRRFKDPHNHPRWKGGCHCHKGYIFIYNPAHPRSNNNGYVKRAIVEVENILGYYLPSYYDVHHNNGIKTDDRLLNLAIMSHSQHSYLHGKERRGLNYGK